MTAQIVSLAAYRAVMNKHGACSHSHIKRASLIGDRRRHLRLGASRDDRRSERRYLVGGKCAPSILVAGSTVNIANVSRNGLMIQAPLQAKVGTRLLLTPVGCRPLSARLIWKSNQLAGLEAPLVSIELHFL